MKKISIILLLFVLLSTTALACHAKVQRTNESGSSIIETLCSSTSTQTPVPTYVPGTDLYGMIDVGGNVIVEPKYEYLDLFSDEGLARFEDHGLWGFVNEKGIEVIKAQYEDAHSFSDGLAAVKVNGLYGFIDERGKMVIEPQYFEIGTGFRFGRCVFSENGKQGMIDKNGEVLLDPQYKSLDLKCEKYFIAEDINSNYGIIDRDGNRIIDCQYPEIYFVTNSGYYFVSGTETEIRDKMYDLEGNVQFVFKHIVPDSNNPPHLLEQDSLINVSPDDASLDTNGKWGIFNLATGTYVIKPIYDSIEYESGDGFAFISLGDKWGVADVSTGNVLIDCINEGENKHESYGYIVYESKNDLWGVMTMNGTSVLPAVYERVVCSPSGEFGVVKDNKCCLLNAEGNTIKELSDSVIVAYVPSINRWIYTNDYDVESVPVYGILNYDGSVFIEPSFENYYLNAKSLIASYYYLNPINSLDSSLIIDISITIDGGGYPVYAIVNTNGYSSESLYRDFEFFPDQKVLVVTDASGKSGLVSYDGTVLFKPMACRFLINKSSDQDGDNNLLTYENYNDSDYFIYTVKTA